MHLKKILIPFGLLMIVSLILTACAGQRNRDLESALEGRNAVVQPEFNNLESLNQEIAWMNTPVEDNSLPIWEQAIDPDWVDTSQFAAEGNFTVCYSRGGENSSWHEVGFNTMKHEVALHPDIEDFISIDAKGSSEKQIIDIEDLLAGGNCDVLIVSPNSSAALIPVIEQACEQIPVVVFERPILTDCPVSFVQPIGNYVFGTEGANFISDNMPNGGIVLAYRTLPSIDVYEKRWIGAKEVFKKHPRFTVIGVEFTEDYGPRAKTITENYINRFGQIDAIWMDSATTTMAVISAFEEAGLDIPIMSVEDRQSFLQRWYSEDLTAIAPTFPTFQWRTAVIAAVKIMHGEPVPSRWVLPQPAVTQENLVYFDLEAMPSGHYAMCGCENMPGYPEDWGGQ